MNQRELLVLEPTSACDGHRPIRFKRLHDIWHLLATFGVSDLRGRPTISLKHCYWLMLAQLVLDEIDFEFDEQNQPPEHLPDDLTGYRNILIYAEEFGRHAPRLRQDFPGADEYVAKLADQPHPFRFTPSRDAERRLYVRPLSRLITPVQWGFLYWSMRLTPGAAGFRRRQLARPDRQVFDQTLTRVRSGAENPRRAELYPPFKCGQIMGHEWTEVSAIQQRLYLELGDLQDDPRFTAIGERSIRLYLHDRDWRRRPRNADQWSMVAPIACLYEKTGEQSLLDVIRLRFEQRQREWGSWRGCYGNWPDPPDQWLRDSSLSNMVASAVIAASKLTDDLGVDTQAVYEQATHQAVTTEELLRDPETGWYRFGADGSSMVTPSFATHGSYWHIYALSMLVAHLPETAPGFRSVVAVYRRLAEALARAQGPDGLWPMNLDRCDPGTGNAGYTAAITGSLLRGLSLGVLDAKRFEKVVRRGIDGVKLRSFAGYMAGGVLSCGITTSPRYYNTRTQREELSFGTWQQLFLMAEAIRWSHHPVLNGPTKGQKQKMPESRPATNDCTDLSKAQQ